MRDIGVTGVQTCALPILPALCEPVERLTGRKVRAFASGIDSVADGVAVETFVLYPKGSADTSRRSEERRVGKEWRAGWSSYHYNKSLQAMGVGGVRCKKG